MKSLGAGRVRHFWWFVVLAFAVADGCAHPSFRLTEDSALDRVMATRQVQSLREEIPSRRLMARVDDVRPEAIYVYVGDDEGDHTTRVGFYRVTPDGRVWRNRDETGLEERWEVVQ